MSGPLLPIDLLLAECRSNKGTVVIWDVAIRDAEAFRLFGKKAIIECLCSEKVVGPVYKNTLPLETWKGKLPAPLVEAYVFQLGTKFVYIAYYKIEKTGNWNIKSFKENESEKLMFKSLNVVSKIDLKSSPFKHNDKLEKFLIALKENEEKGDSDE